MPANSEIIKVVKEKVQSEILTRSHVNGPPSDDYKENWLKFTGGISGESLSAFTTKQIQKVVLERFGTADISVEKKVVGVDAGLKFDIWNKPERTAFEICLGAIKNEFEKDILKGLLDQDTIRLVIFYREYVTGAKGRPYGKSWLGYPAQKAILERAKILKLEVEPVSLLG